MPYESNSPDLPSYVKKLSPELRAKWVLVYNEAYKEAGVEAALIAANSWLKRKLTESKRVAKDDKHVEIIKFEIDETKEFISRSEDGEEYISFKLADVRPDKAGYTTDEAVLKKWAEKINSGEVLLGDLDHEEWNRWVSADIPEQELRQKVNGKKTIAKAIKAVVEKGRLWIKAIIDKRYRALLKKVKGASLEAAVVTDETNRIHDGDLFGFSFIVDGEPGVHGTEVYA